MTVGLHIDEPAHTLEEPGTAPGTDQPLDRPRPNVSGDLPGVFSAAPMFRRVVAGYDPYQVDTYVQWAEEELATADREREHLMARHLSTRAALEEARRLLPHSAGGGEFLRLSRRMGTMLAAAADEAERMRVEAEAEAEAASVHAEQTVATAERALAQAEAEADRLVAEAAGRAEDMAAEAGLIVAAAQRTLSEARAEAEARLEEVRAVECRAAEHAHQVRQRAAAEVSAARSQARAEIVAMLGTGREERRRADAAAAAIRERLDREAATRYVSLVADVQALEQRRAALRQEVAVLAASVTEAPGGRWELAVRRLVERLPWRSGSLRAR